MKRYQPTRTDLLINTDWGTPREQLSKEEAVGRRMKLLCGRWVTREEKKQLREEYSTYHSIRIIGYLLIILTLVIFPINIGEISRGGIIPAALATIYGLVMLVAGAGLIKFKRFARNIAILAFLSFLALPFTALLSDDKGAPVLIILGLSGIYYLLRKTARKIFAPAVVGDADGKKCKSSLFRRGIIAVLLLLALFTAYTIYDMSQAKRMAANACNHAVKDMSLEEFLATIPKEDYRIIRSSDHTMIVPRRGMGRSHCVVYHDGLKMTGAKAGLID